MSRNVLVTTGAAQGSLIRSPRQAGEWRAEWFWLVSFLGGRRPHSRSGPPVRIRVVGGLWLGRYVWMGFEKRVDDGTASMLVGDDGAESVRKPPPEFVECKQARAVACTTTDFTRERRFAKESHDGCAEANRVLGVGQETVPFVLHHCRGPPLIGCHDGFPERHAFNDDDAKRFADASVHDDVGCLHVLFDALVRHLADEMDGVGHAEGYGLALELF